MQDRRSDDRTRAFMAGRIACPEGRAVQDCVVRDLSETGALLLVDAPRFAPAHLDLTLPSSRGSRRARVVWRRGTMLGVAFVPAAFVPAAVPATTVSAAVTVPPSAVVVDRGRAGGAPASRGGGSACGAHGPGDPAPGALPSRLGLARGGALTGLDRASSCARGDPRHGARSGKTRASHLPQTGV